MIFKDIQGVYTKCQYMCSMHKMYICVRMHVCLDGKIGINYVHMDWQLSEYAIVLNIAHLILKGRMYTTDCFL